jgi:hypothetical protein
MLYYGKDKRSSTGRRQFTTAGFHSKINPLANPRNQATKRNSCSVRSSAQTRKQQTFSGKTTAATLYESVALAETRCAVAKPRP